MEPKFSRVDAERFFDRLGFPNGRFREARLIDPDDGRVAQYYCRSVADAIAVAGGASGRLNVYVGACPRFRRGGTKDDVNTVLAFWADLDFHQFDSNRDVALEMAYRRIEALGIPPTMLVHSGNGLQVWWLFHEPAAITDQLPAERFESINIGLGQRLGGDHVHDLARVLRVPGTWNLPDARKKARGCVPVLARLLDDGGPRYRPEDFLHIEVRGRVATRPSRGNASIVAEPDREIVESFEQLLRELAPDHLLVRTWLGDRAIPDRSRSGMDMALVNQLYKARVREDCIPHLLRAFRFGRGRLASDGYIRLTMAKATSRNENSHG